MSIGILITISRRDLRENVYLCVDFNPSGEIQSYQKIT